MELPASLDRLILLVHVIAGTLTLISGFISMMTHKGGRNHRWAGKTFFWSMFVIFISSFGTIFLFRFNPFLLGINIFAFYMTFTGYRVTYRKRGAGGQNPQWIDWLAMILATIGAIYLIFWGVQVLLGVLAISWSTAFGGLAIGFGIFILYTSLWEDARLFVRPTTDRRWWWYYHMERMLGGMIGAVTAFLVQSLGDSALLGSFSWVIWVAPGVVGALGINYWVTHYQKKFRRARQ